MCLETCVTLRVLFPPKISSLSHISCSECHWKRSVWLVIKSDAQMWLQSGFYTINTFKGNVSITAVKENPQTALMHPAFTVTWQTVCWKAEKTIKEKCRCFFVLFFTFFRADILGESSSREALSHPGVPSQVWRVRKSPLSPVLMLSHELAAQYSHLASTLLYSWLAVRTPKAAVVTGCEHTGCPNLMRRSQAIKVVNHRKWKRSLVLDGLSGFLALVDGYRQGHKNREISD